MEREDRQEQLDKGYADAKEHHEIHEEIFLLRGISSYCQGWNNYVMRFYNEGKILE